MMGIFGSKMEPSRCEPLGLIVCCDKPAPVPLTGVKVAVKIVDLAAEVEVTQKYVNRELQPIEAVYKFPLDEGAAVFHFSAVVEDREIVGIVKAAEEAEKVYDKAIESGQTAFLVEETLPDVFKAKIGNIPPGGGATITIKYIMELPVVEDGKVRFSLPTTIAPRYIPAYDKSDTAKDLASIPYTLEPSYSMEFTATVSMASAIVSVESPSHELKKSIEGRSGTITTVGEKVRMNEDLVLVIAVEESHKPRFAIEQSEEGTHAVMVSLVPEFKLKEQKTELIFLVDRSGSMDGESIQQAREALQVFFHSLPVDCYFNIIGFGSTFESLFPQSLKYDDGSLKDAIQHAKGLQANLGGTELFPPLQHVLNQKPIEGYLRQIFVLTDGEVSNTEQVLALVRQFSHKSRVFALGLGRSASHHLVGGIARLGGGTAVYATVEEKLDKKVLGQLKDALHPAITDISVQLKGISETEVSAASLYRKAPSKVPPVFDGKRFVVYALLKKETKLPSGAIVTAVSPDGPLRFDLELSQMSLASKLVHRLAAKKLIQELTYENSGGEEETKSEIIKLGLQYSLVSKYTSFVAVDPKEHKPVEGSWAKMQSREVPQDLASGWHGGFGGFAAPRMMACSAAPMPMMSFSAMAPPSGGFAPLANFSARRMAKAQPIQTVCDSFGDSVCNIIQTESAVGLVSADSMDFAGEASARESFGSKRSAPSLLMQLIHLQKFDGCYVLDDHLCQLVGVALEEAEKTAAALGIDTRCMAAALAIHYFEQKLAGDQDSWELVVGKARKFIERTSAGKNIDDILKVTSTLFGN